METDQTSSLRTKSASSTLHGSKRREDNFHPSCRKSFNLKYINHIRDEARNMNRAIYTDQDRTVTAHLKAFDAVLDMIGDQVIRQNEVFQLASLHSRVGKKWLPKS